jgi:hypothetical protein
VQEPGNDFVDNQRFLVKEGLLTRFKGEGKNKKEHKLHLILFNDMVTNTRARMSCSSSTAVSDSPPSPFALSLSLSCAVGLDQAADVQARPVVPRDQEDSDQGHPDRRQRAVYKHPQFVVGHSQLRHHRTHSLERLWYDYY